MIGNKAKAILSLVTILFTVAPVIAAEDFPISVEAEVGMGFDDNVYRTPGGIYFDPRTGAGEFINPDVQEGAFVATRIDAKLDYSFNETVAVQGKYSFDGSFYTETDTNNSDEQSHSGSIGLEFAFIPERKQRGTIYVGPFAKLRDKIHVDRDTGMPTTTEVSETDISGKYTYDAFGGEAIIEKRFDAFKVAVNGSYSEYTYDDPVVISTNDKTRTSGGIDFSFDATDDTKLKAGYLYTLDEFDERRPHELDGTSGPANERVEYVYHDLSAGIKQSFGKNIDVFLEYHHIIRSDEYKGYYDYNKNTIDGKIVVKPIENLKLTAKGGYTQTDYSNAFAYDLTAYPDLEYKITDAGVRGEYMFTKNFGAWVEYDYTKEDTPDERYAYDRQRGMIGLKVQN